MEKRIREIQAIHKQNLNVFLQNLGILDSFSKGELKCDSCGTIVTQDNLGAIYSRNGAIVVCCSSTDCLYIVKKIMEGKRHL